MREIAQIFGAVAILSSIVIYQQKTRKRLLSFKLVQDVCWCIHYLILGAYSAAATSFICTSRSVIYYNNDKPIFASKLWLLIYICLYAVSAVFTWNGIFSIFPAMSSILSSIGFWVKQPIRTKAISVCASACTLVYNINVSHSAMVYIGVTLTISSALISIFRELYSGRTKAEKRV